MDLAEEEKKFIISEMMAQHMSNWSGSNWEFHRQDPPPIITIHTIKNEMGTRKIHTRSRERDGTTAAAAAA